MPRPTLVLAGFALVSGILSAYAADDPWKLFVFQQKPLLPGIYFGTALSFGVYRWGTQSKFDVLTVLVATVIAWVLAQESARLIVESQSPSGNRIGLMPGVVAGVVGASVVTYGIASVCQRFRNVWTCARTVVIGGCVGAFFDWAIGGSPPSYFRWAMFLSVWQVSVAASVGFGLEGTLLAGGGQEGQSKGFEMAKEEKPIDRLMYELEDRKFLWEQSKYPRESNIINRNFGVIATGIISAIVSLLQSWCPMCS
jgi:hypothetical protein